MEYLGIRYGFVIALVFSLPRSRLTVDIEKLATWTAFNQQHFASYTFNAISMTSFHELQCHLPPLSETPSSQSELFSARTCLLQEISFYVMSPTESNCVVQNEPMAQQESLTNESHVLQLQKPIQTVRGARRLQQLCSDRVI